MKLLLSIPFALLAWIPWNSEVETVNPAACVDCLGCEVFCTPSECTEQMGDTLEPLIGFDGQYDDYDPDCHDDPLILCIDEDETGVGFEPCAIDLGDPFGGRVEVDFRIKKTGTARSIYDCKFPIQGSENIPCDQRHCKFGWKVSYFAWDWSGTGECILFHAANEMRIEAEIWKNDILVSNFDCSFEGGTCKAWEWTKIAGDTPSAFYCPTETKIVVKKGKICGDDRLGFEECTDDIFVMLTISCPICFGNSN